VKKNAPICLTCIFHTFCTQLVEVTDTFVRTSDHINYLTIIDEQGHEQTIETTDGHPFWVVTDNPDLNRAARDYVFENGSWLYHEDVTPTEHGYWVEAKDLRVGDVFLGANGEPSTLTNVVRVEQSGGIAVFNFSVEGNHNYFVLAKEFEYGQSCILVHNAEGYVYRGLHAGEDPSRGLLARDPDAGISAWTHVNGAEKSQWISTTKLREVAEGKYNSGHGVVEIDLSKVSTEIVDISNGGPGGWQKVLNFARKDQEVLIKQSVPPEAIKVLQ